MSAGLSSAGFQRKTLEEIKADIEADLLSEVDTELDLGSDQPMGQIVGIFSSHLGEVWELLETAFHAFDPTKAEGQLLNGVCALTGTKKTLATYGKVTLSCVFTGAGIVLPVTSKATCSGDVTNEWQLDEETYSSGYTSTGAGAADVVFRSVRTGPIPASAGDIDTIVTAVAGWTSVTNTLDATQGTNEETEAELRLKREVELEAQGSCNAPTLTAELLKIGDGEDVTDALVIVNKKPRIVDGLPPHSFKALIWDGVTPAATNADVFRTVLQHQPSGIECVGDVTGTLTDEHGVTHYLAFSRAEQVEVTVNLNVDIDPALFPADGYDQMEEAVLEYGATLGISRGDGKANVIRMQVIGYVMAKGIPGLIDLYDCTLATPTVPAAAANLVIAIGQIAVMDTSRINIIAS